jgi:hypothetical protein
MYGRLDAFALPQVTAGPFSRGPESRVYQAGATMALKWIPTPGAPNPWRYWIQLVYTNGGWGNLPSYSYPINVNGSPYWIYIDAPGAGFAKEPFYNFGGTANHSYFLDCPNYTWALGNWDLFFTFKAYDRDDKTIVISEQGVS